MRRRVGGRGRAVNRRVSSPKANRRSLPRVESVPVKPPSGPGTRDRMRRLYERARQARVGHLLAGVILLGGVVYGGVLAHRFVVQSPHFHVRRVDVSPTVHVSADEIRRLAGIGARTNVFSVDLERVAARVARHPWIASAKAYRRLPNAVRISVKEHEAAAAVLMQARRPEQTRFYLVNAEGHAFKRADFAELEGLALITGIRREEYLKHKRSSSKAIREALDVYRRYRARPGRPRIGEVNVDPVEGVTLYTASRAVQVRFGRGDMAAKLRRFDRVTHELAQRGQRAATIRLNNARHPRQVTVRLAEAEASSDRSLP